MTSSEDNPSHQQNLETDEGKATDKGSSAAHPAEAHRPLVREIDRSLGAAYGYGGGAVMLGTVLGVGMAWWWGRLWSPVTWLVVVTAALVGLFVVRTAVRRRADRLRQRLQQYCQANDITPEQLRGHFGREDFYTFFEALFELQERRRRLQDGREDHDESQGGHDGPAT